MNKIVSLLLLLVAFISCSNDDDKEGKLLENRTVDLSDFSMYVGSESGATQVTFNNLKNSELVRRYFPNRYAPDRFRYNSMRFAENKLTYIWGTSSTNRAQLVSSYYFKDDSLFIEKGNGSREFVALGTNEKDLYRKMSLARYYDTETQENISIGGSDQESIPFIDLEAMLKLRGYSNKEQMTNPTDTLIWCNVIYRFE